MLEKIIVIGEYEGRVDFFVFFMLYNFIQGCLCLFVLA